MLSHNYLYGFGTRSHPVEDNFIISYMFEEIESEGVTSGSEAYDGGRRRERLNQRMLRMIDDGISRKIV